MEFSVPDADGWAVYACGTREETIGILQNVIEEKPFDKNGYLTNHKTKDEVILYKRCVIDCRK